MKKTIIAIVSFIILTQMTSTVSAKEYPQRFWDVPKTHWAFGYVAEFADKGIIEGYEDGSFKPENTVSRAEWAKMIAETAGLKTDDESIYYNDLKGHWAIKYVNAAKDFVGAFPDGLYYPDQPATREDVTVSMVKLNGYDVSNVDYSHLMKFKDLDSISDSAKKYISVAVQNGLISGYEDNTFRGQATLTRAEAATLLSRAFLTYEEQQEITAPKDYSVYNGYFSGGGSPYVSDLDGQTHYVGTWSAGISNATADSLEFWLSINESDFAIQGMLYKQPDGSYYGYGVHWHDKHKSNTSIWLESLDCILLTYTWTDGSTETERLYRHNYDEVLREIATKGYSDFNGNFSGGGTFAPYYGEYIGVWHATVLNATADSLEFGLSVSESDFCIGGTLYRQPNGSYYGSAFYYDEWFKEPYYVTVWLEKTNCIWVTYTELDGSKETERLYRHNYYDEVLQEIAPKDYSNHKSESDLISVEALAKLEEEAGKNYSIYNGDFEGGGVFDSDGYIMQVWDIIISNTTADSLEFNFIMSDSMFGIEGTLYRQPDGSYYGYGLHWHDKYKVSTSIWLESPECILVTYTEPNGFTAAERLYRTK